MYILRPIKEKDLDAFEEFAKKSSLGLINLPKNRDTLKEKIFTSVKAFKTSIQKPYHEQYTFVLEDTVTGQLGGTCGITSRMGVTEPNYYFRIEKIRNEYTGKEMEVLSAVHYPIGPTEICALYLKAEFRKEGLGKLLSLSRFLFIASHRERFEDYVVAEMRGYIKEDNSVPFWDSFCRKFLDVNYDVLCCMEQETRAFIPHIIPQWPVYTLFLPKEVQECMGKVHEKTIPALKMLNQEGFTFTNEIDPFDGGPKVGCLTDEIATIKNSETALIYTVEDLPTESTEYLISNTSLDFRACYGHVKKIKKGFISISQELSEALEIGIGDEIRFIKLPPKEKHHG